MTEDPSVPVRQRPTSGDATSAFNDVLDRDVASSDDVTRLRAAPTEAAPRHLAPQVLKSRFVLEEPLGSGGMGTVYRARDLRKVEAQDRQPYLAIKVLNGSFREHPDAFIALQREAARSQSLSHPNIVSIFDFDKDGDVPFMTMELLHGEELAAMLKRHPQGLPPEQAWPVIDGLLSAVQHAHAEGLIHADLKPGNVFVTHTGQTKVLDFGLARAVHANLGQGVLQTRLDVEDAAYDPDNLGALTPAFASAAVLGGASAGPADDLFAAALVVYQVLTGRHPYNRLPADRVAAGSVLLERPAGLNGRQWRALQSALALDARDRLASVAVLRDALFRATSNVARATMAGLGALVLTVTAAYLSKDSQLQAAQQQVVVAAQEAKVTERHDRLRELLDQPSFTPTWEQQTASELARLASLPDAAARFAAARADLAALYERQVLVAGDLDRAAALAERGLRFGELRAARRELRVRYAQRLDRLLAEPELSQAWLGDVEATLVRLQQFGEADHDYALQEMAVNDAYLALLSDTPAESRFEDSRLDSRLDTQAEAEAAAATAATLATLLRSREFDLDLVRAAEDARLAQLERQVRLEHSAEAVRRARQRLSELSDSQCTADAPARAAATPPGLAGADLERVLLDGLATDCLTLLARSSPSAAAALRQRLLSAQPDLPQLRALRIDPCIDPALIGAGGQDAFCRDVLASGSPAPLLVVVPAMREAMRDIQESAIGDSIEDIQGQPASKPVTPSVAFAMTRYELAWSEYEAFCQTTGDACVEGGVALAVADIDIGRAEAFIAWLSKESGFRYRLPTLSEWRWASSSGGRVDPPDPARNCRLELSGVVGTAGPVAPTLGTANDFGLVNMLGNLQEWVRDRDQLVAAGGHFDDPLDECLHDSQRPADGNSSVHTGLRLVRELTPAARERL